MPRDVSRRCEREGLAYRRKCAIFLHLVWDVQAESSVVVKAKVLKNSVPL